MISPGVFTELVNLAASLAVRAGAIAETGRRSHSLEVDTKSTSVDLVTQWDRTCEKFIVEGLLHARPDDGLCGEEGSSANGSTGVVWHIDPIDGTTNFAFGLPGYAVSIAAVDTDGPLAGAVYLPSSHELFTASRGGGAFLGGQRIRCSDRRDLATSLIATGFGYSPDRRRQQARRVAAMIGEIRDIRRLGAAAGDLCNVACGRVDGFFEENLNSWDMMAGVLIASESGAIASDFSGGDPRPAELVVCAPGIHQELLRLLATSSS